MKHGGLVTAIALFLSGAAGVVGADSSTPREEGRRFFLAGRQAFQAGRLEEASALLAHLVTDPAHAGRRAELERTLGDVERERGDCTSARTHYRAALDFGARGDEASAVRRGLGMCEAE